MTSLLTEDQREFIDRRRQIPGVIGEFIKIIDLQNKVIEKCQEQRDFYIRTRAVTEEYDQELREIMDVKG